MFLFEKSLTRGRRDTKAAKYVRYLCVLFLFTNFLFLGCEEPKDEKSSLHGTWKSDYGETFIINLFAKTYKNPADGEWGDYTLEGDIVEIAEFNNYGTAGIIYIEITSKGDMFGINGNGNFTGIHFKYLDNTIVEFSTASDSSYRTPVYPSLQNAKAALNENSLGNYFALGSACKKQ